MNYTKCFNRSRVDGLQIVCSPFFVIRLHPRACKWLMAACGGLWWLVAIWLHPRACKWLMAACGYPAAHSITLYTL